MVNSILPQFGCTDDVEPIGDNATAFDGGAREMLVCENVGIFE